MRQADAFHISHPIAKIYPEILRHTLRLAKLAGKEQDALRRNTLIAELHGVLAGSTALAAMAEALHRGHDHEHRNGNAVAHVGHRSRLCLRLQARDCQGDVWLVGMAPDSRRCGCSRILCQPSMSR